MSLMIKFWSVCENHICTLLKSYFNDRYVIGLKLFHSQSCKKSADLSCGVWVKVVERAYHMRDCHGRD